MNIVLLINNFPPEIGSAADVFYQIALGLHGRGHTVKVLTTQARHYNVRGNSFQKLKKNRSFWNIEELYPRFIIYRVRLLPIIYPRSGTNPYFRSLEHILQPFLITAMFGKIKSSDILLAYSPPLLLGYLCTLIGKILGIPTIVNVQDIHPKAIIDLGLIKNNHLYSFLKIIERLMYKYASAITVHSNGNKKIVIAHGANPQNVFTIYNVCNIPSDNLIQEGDIFRKKHSLEDKFIITYAGTMSFSQDLDTIIKAAYILSKNSERFVFLLVGDGPQRNELEIFYKKLKMHNVIFLPFQEGDDYWRLLSASDICLVSLKKSKVKTPVVPRKLNDIMAVGRPVIANVPLDGDVTKIIDLVNCGKFVESENPKALCNSILEMFNLSYDKRIKYGINGRIFAKNNYSVKSIIKKYEFILERVGRF